MPLYRRLPKSGFKNMNRIEYTAINLDVLERLATEKGLTTIDRQVLKENGLASKNDKIKILGRGELNACVHVTVDACSAKAKEAIEAKGYIGFSKNSRKLAVLLFSLSRISGGESNSF